MGVRKEIEKIIWGFSGDELQARNAAAHSPGRVGLLRIVGHSVSEPLQHNRPVAPDCFRRKSEEVGIAAYGLVP